MIILGLDMERGEIFSSVFIFALVALLSGFYLNVLFLLMRTRSSFGGIKKIKELKLNMSQLDSDKYYKIKDKLWAK